MPGTALVTGASSGIGKALCHEFGAHGHDLVVVAEDEAPLRAVAEELAAQHDVAVHPIARDLTRLDAPREVYDEVKAAGLIIEVLVNDAGVGQRGSFVEVPLEKDLRIIRLDIEALVVLSKLFLRDMVARNSGRVMNLGSVAGFEPGPLLAVYHATKAFVVSFSEALATELEDLESDVTVTCLCPGPTATHFFERAEAEQTRAADMVMDPQKVAQYGYEALMDGERVAIPGASNKVMVFSRRVIPKSAQARVSRMLYESKEE